MCNDAIHTLLVVVGVVRHFPVYSPRRNDLMEWVVPIGLRVSGGILHS